MKYFIGIGKKLEDNTMFYREPVQTDKDWSGVLCSEFFACIISRAAEL